MSEELLQQGIDALKAGDKRKARRLFGQLVHQSPEMVVAWWYLATSVEDLSQKIHCLEQVLRLHPDHAEAKKLLAQLEKKLKQATPSKGYHRPIIEMAAGEDGALKVQPPVARPPLATSQPPVKKQKEAFRTFIVPFVAVVFLSVILIAVLIIRNNSNTEELPVDLTPASHQLTLNLPACTTNEEGLTIIIFENTTEYTVEILQGPKGEEDHLLTLAAGEEGQIEAKPQLLLRYAVQSESPDTISGGAIIEIPPGNTCRVPVQ